MRQDGHWLAVGECLCLVASIKFLLVAVFGVNDWTDLNYATCHSRHDSQTISFEEALSYTQRSPITLDNPCMGSGEDLDSELKYCLQ